MFIDTFTALGLIGGLALVAAVLLSCRNGEACGQ